MSKMQKAQSIIQDRDKIDEENKVEMDPEKMRTHDVVSTGSIMADYIIGGNKTATGEPQCPGFPRGKITEVFGPQGSGKTTLTLHACAQAQRSGGSAVFIDFENAISLDWASKIGVDLEDDEKWHLWQPNVMEEGFELIDAYISAGVDIVVVDSIPAMTPQKELEGNISDIDQGGIGLKARLMSRLTQKIVNQNEGTALVFINQVRQNISTGYGGGGETTPGGNAIKFYTSLRLRLEEKSTKKDQVVNELTGEEKTEPVETETELKVIKTKVSGHRYKKGRFWIRFNQGIDNIRTVIKMAEYNDLVEQKGSWFYYQTPSGEEEKVQGRQTLRDKIIEDDQLRKWLVEQVVETDEDTEEDEEE